jgi:Asp-tRNA(Asn)/Glu-tRNA(Gln) amidotransferase B subunit
MRSLLDNELKKVEEELLLNSPNDDGDELINTIPDKSVNIENKVIFKQEINNILSLFDDDKLAKELIEGMMENFNKKEILELLSLKDVEYESKLKKIRRRIYKKYPKGIDL